MARPKQFDVKHVRLILACTSLIADLFPTFFDLKPVVFDRLIDVNFSEKSGSIRSDDFMEELIARLKSLQSLLHFK